MTAQINARRVGGVIAGIVAATTLSLSAAAQSDIPPALAAVMALETDGPVYAFDLQFSDPAQTVEGRIDPSQPEGQRVTLTSPSIDALDDDTRKAIENIDKEATGNIWCLNFAEMLNPPFELVSQAADAATYRFTPQPADGEGRKFLKHLTAEITVWLDKPDVKAFRMFAEKPFKPAMVAKVNAFDMSASCVRGPDGRAYRETMTTKVSGSAMGRSFDEQNSQVISNLTLAGIPDAAID